MSSNLYYQPRLAGEKILPTELKLILRNSTHTDGVPGAVDEYNIGYFRGLADAGVKGADKLVEAYDKYGELSLREEF